MEKLVFRKFFIDTLNFFLISTLSLSLIVWVIQAVNYLDFVSEDGHSFKVYFYYTLLNFPKIFSRLIVFMFFLSIFYTILKYEERNELIIFWINGVKKKYFLNFILKFSVIIVLVHLFLNIFIVPKSQDLARSFIRTSNVDYLPSLIKSKKFINTVENLTVFIEKKNPNGEFVNIYLKDTLDKENSKIISAKKGIISKKNDVFFLELYSGNILEKNKNDINVLSYDTTQINLSDYSTKTTIHPKIQELPTKLLLKCMFSIKINKTGFEHKYLMCSERSFKNVTEELYKRIIVPFYIIILAMIGSCLTLRSQSDSILFNYKLFLFVLGIIFVILSQVLSQYIGNLNLLNVITLIFPFILSACFYFLIQFSLKS